MVKKIVKKIGDSFYLLITPDELKIYGLKEGSIINIEIIKEGNKR